MLLGVNIDHVATVRNARGSIYPSPLEAALLAETHGADLITMHLREDRRHIHDADVFAVKNAISTRLNLEMALTPEMLDNALAVQPADVCIVPEKRQEITTEGGLDVLSQQDKVAEYTLKLTAAGIRVSLFVDADKQQIQACREVGAPVIELHTGAYADSTDKEQRQQQLARIEEAAHQASEMGIIVNAGHGLNIHNVTPIAKILAIHELNIGHALIAQAIFIGLPQAIEQMKTTIFRARSIPY
ncbi:pyridoxine 5'-phosphate synthase [Snodgrassella communis]|uniref:Pyridoxine 5'-phosphate synthase n=1 Tax=Snodgrassella communis TaxID=2946699 RepID=A0A836MR00_9NEIS|nr:pyridoxine 5'-phosphate synthase [Snodgrassella communis]KDN14820.1 Pyridoxine 5'-phosphate synthase [Snodgrassella communis]PIT07474.1 pyridoxine 5'-phosphate synthase [Snodgrassella communis]PIT28121.1 pyridoxine 5'-phosphate synthase [Snodgrassella communis]PIT30214.1 pyridoxine 5'-phosphate synthase [Snodgrassella communis]PIT37984.1 pyridoxine 5'-phosphate synthase [Snodgrassella communis]